MDDNLFDIGSLSSYIRLLYLSKFKNVMIKFLKNSWFYDFYLLFNADPELVKKRNEYLEEKVNERREKRQKRKE